MIKYRNKFIFFKNLITEYSTISIKMIQNQIFKEWKKILWWTQILIFVIP